MSLTPKVLQNINDAAKQASDIRCIQPINYQTHYVSYVARYKQTMKMA